MVAELSIYEQAKAIYGEGAIGYVAGIVDGEGSIGAYISADKSDRRWHLAVKITIANVNRDVLDACQIILGGKVKLISRTIRGNRKPCYGLLLSGKPSVERALLIIHDYLIVKCEVASLMLELIDSKKTHYQGYSPRELEIVTEMRDLNRRGLK